ncbi:homoaconitase [Patellaria atrata CBS 101060]|uniref:Homoaconitase, mitochondrial n=1 Tax=Patellaria atrata CBS 101060 TaxID=1346257 RepID=A0A9P4SGP3_9PEZI|nr:homoaconitase [Patellaria atrata CBS 101060]
MTTEWGALSAIFPQDTLLERWLRFKATEAALFKASQLADGTTAHRFNHPRIDSLIDVRLAADPNATYAKTLHLDLSTVTPYVSGPNSVKVATPLSELEAQSLKVDKAYLVSCTNSRASDLAAAAKVFKEKAVDGKVPKIPEHVKFYIAAASIPEQRAAEEQGDWQTLLDAGAIALPSGCGPCIGLGTGLLEPGEIGISASNRNFKGRMGSTEAKAYLASPEVVAASALNGKISGPGWYEKPAGWTGVIRGEGDGIRDEDRMIRIEDALQQIIDEADALAAEGEKTLTLSSSPTTSTPKAPTQQSEEQLASILPGFPEQISGEIVFCDADNINTDGIYPGKYTYQDNVSRTTMAEVCMENYDKAFRDIAKAGDILVAGFNFGTGSSREQAATALLAKEIPLVVAGSFGNIFSRNSINNALMGVEVPRLIERLRKTFGAETTTQKAAIKGEVTEPSSSKDRRESSTSPPSGPTAMPQGEKVLTRRTGWTLTWDVRRSKVVVKEGEGGEVWEQKVGELSESVQDIIAKGGLEKWVKASIGV